MSVILIVIKNDNITYMIVKYMYDIFLSENNGIFYKRLKLLKKCFNKKYMIQFIFFK